MMRAIALVILSCFLLADARAGTRSTDEASPPIVRRDFEWSKELLEQASLLPIQDGGRVKPLSTFAAFTMLKLNGSSSGSLPVSVIGDKTRASTITCCESADGGVLGPGSTVIVLETLLLERSSSMLSSVKPNSAIFITSPATNGSTWILTPFT